MYVCAVLSRTGWGVASSFCDTLRPVSALVLGRWLGIGGAGRGGKGVGNTGLGWLGV